VTIASLIVDVAANTVKLVQDVEKIDKQLGGIVSMAGKVGAALGIGFSVGAVVNFGKALLDDADALTKLHDKTGVSIEGLGRLQAAGDDAGNTLEQLTAGINMMQKRLTDGDKSAVGALGKLHLGLDDLKRLEPDAQFMAIADAIREVKDPAEQVALAVAIFGKSGAELLPTIKRGFDDIKNTAPGMSAEAVKALDDVGDAIANLWRRTKNTIGEVLGDTVAAVQAVHNATSPGAIDVAAGKYGTLAEKVVTVNDLLKTLAGPKVSIPSPLPTMLAPEIAALDKFNAKQDAQIEATNKARKAAEELARTSEKVYALERGLALVPDSLHKIGRSFDEAKLGTLADDIARVEQNAHVANFGFAGMVDGLNDVGRAAGHTADELDDFARFDFTGPVLKVQTLKDKFKGAGDQARESFGVKAHKALSDVGDILSNIPGKVGEIGSMAAKAGKAIMENLASGNVWGAVVAGATAAIGIVTKLFSNPEKQVNPVREAFVQLNGGLATLNAKAAGAGVTLNAMLNARTPEAYKKAIDDLNAAFKFQDDAMKVLDDTVNKYGFSIEQLGPKFAAQKLNEQAGTLLQDYQVLTAAGVNHNAILEKMAPSLQAYVNKSLETKTAIPENMRPVLQGMVDLGLLTDASGEKMSDLSKLTFTETLDEKFSTLIKTIDKLAEAISRGVGGAIAALPTQKTIHIGYDVEALDLGNRRSDYAARGGLVTPVGIQHFETGGTVLPFAPRGTDTVPAMLTPGEMVLTRQQQTRLFRMADGRPGGGSPIDMAEFRALRESQERLERYMRTEFATDQARANRDELQKVARR
jgi:hypothetical protein